MTTDPIPPLSTDQTSAPNAPFLHPAPTAKKDNRILLVIVCGLSSTLLALALVFALDRADMNVMGWYANYVFPVGAILVGLVASSGYAIGAWGMGLRFSRILLVAIVLLQIFSYFGIKYAGFAVQGPLVDRTGRVVGFMEYYHITTVNSAWKEEHGKLGKPLGNLGYLIRLGEITGFALGTLIAPIALSRKPYCELCERYMKTKVLALLPASKFKKGHLFGKPASEMTEQEVMETSMASAVQLVSLAATGNTPALTENLAAVQPLRKQAKKLRRTLRLQLVYCAQCHSGYIEIIQTETKGRNTNRISLGRTELQRQVISDLHTQNVV